ncbi:MAG: type II toxin-antitoxin system VapC family toxin [Alphaproteobacteria bacterium]|nr:type II toxin-antitoxin system VapC family toxin [Alphaproteobacteria bacterium]
MSVLLDTHYVFGLADSPGSVSRREARFLDAHPKRLVVSAVSFWEIRLKWNSIHRSGDRKGPASPAEVLRVVSGQPVALLSLSATHAATELEVPLSHKDPFDELLLAQAQSEGLKLLTRDKLLRGHPLVEVIE